MPEEIKVGRQRKFWWLINYQKSFIFAFSVSLWFVWNKVARNIALQTLDLAHNLCSNNSNNEFPPSTARNTRWNVFDKVLLIKLLFSVIEFRRDRVRDCLYQQSLPGHVRNQLSIGLFFDVSTIIETIGFGYFDNREPKYLWHFVVMS